jgi:hypothetical protein
MALLHVAVFILPKSARCRVAQAEHVGKYWMEWKIERCFCAACDK